MSKRERKGPPRPARFKLDVPLHAIGAPDGVTVTVHRAIDAFEVRIKRRRRTYTLPLSTVAGMVVHRLVLVEAAAKRAAKKNRKRRNRS